MKFLLIDCHDDREATSCDRSAFEGLFVRGILCALFDRGLISRAQYEKALAQLDCHG
jgi:hypothetical protein